MSSTPDTTTQQAKLIATNDVTACVVDSGITAGTRHFVDLWARDSLFAAFGAPPELAKTTIETFLKFQRDDGLIPYRIFRRGNMLLPNFRSIQSGGIVPDGGLMTIIAAQQFKNKYRKQVQRARAWYKNTFGDGLIFEWFQCEWADAVLKVGKTLYTNVLYWEATKSPGIRAKINETFWNGRYFADWVDYRRQDYFASHPNMLAIIFGLATKNQAENILTVAKTCWQGFTLHSNLPAYPFWRIPVQNYLVGIPDYHNGCLWLQPGILYAVALHKYGRVAEAKKVLGAVAGKIVEYNGVYELYEKNGRPVRRLFYKAEHPFAWSAGLFLWARNVIYNRPQISPAS